MIKEAQKRYYAKAIKRFHFDLNRNTDADIIAKLEEEKGKDGMLPYIKKLIRADLAK